MSANASHLLLRLRSVTPVTGAVDDPEADAGHIDWRHTPLTVLANRRVPRARRTVPATVEALVDEEPLIAGVGR